MPTNVTQYVFGNSLVNYSEGGAQTNIAVWMDAFADAAGNGFAINGGYGFLRNFADRAVPGSEWAFQGVNSAWDGNQSFADANFNTVIITPANFIQYQSPQTNYEGDSRSPLDATLDVVNDVQAAEPGARIYIYEGWADMAPFASGVPASPQALAGYHAYNMGGYHDWFTSYVDQINAADPDAQVTLIPVASILSELMTTTLSDVSPQVFYTDDAPHGTETLYFLAGMITYSAVFGEAPPAGYAVPGVIDASVATRFDELSSAILARVEDGTGFPDPDPDPDPDGGTDDGWVPQQAEPNPPFEVNPDAPSAPAAASSDVVLRDDLVQVGSGQTTAINVLANDSGALRLVHVDAAQSGTVALSDGTAVYTAPTDGTTQDSFDYTAMDDAGNGYEARVDIRIGQQNLTFQQSAGYTEVNPAYQDAGDSGDFGTWSDDGSVFSSRLSVSEDGRYTLRLYSDDALSARINGEALDIAREDAAAGSVAQVTLAAGTHDLDVVYTPGLGSEEVALQIEGPGVAFLSAASDDATGDDLIRLLQLDEDPWDEDLPEDDLEPGAEPA